jgi:uncharacterized RDD family membrane protein YckC
MNCPNCEFVLPENSVRCEKCGTDLIQKPYPLGAPFVAREDREAAAPAEEDKRKADWGFVLDREFDRLYKRFKREEEPKKEKEKERVREIRWGGFFRRFCAFSIDIVMLILLSLFIFYASYIGYRVGLAAHDRAIVDDPIPLLRTGFLGFLFIAATYFVLFHGMDGRTIGKWLLGLRVVGRNQEPVTYAQAFLRLIGYIPSSVFGLGFIWILLTREKRGWHDLLAGTWVIRE